MLSYTRFWSRVAHNCLNFALVLVIVIGMITLAL